MTESVLGVRGQAGAWAVIRDILGTALASKRSSSQFLCPVATRVPVQTKVPLNVGSISIGQWHYPQVPGTSLFLWVSVFQCADGSCWILILPDQFYT